MALTNLQRDDVGLNWDRLAGMQLVFFEGTLLKTSNRVRSSYGHEYNHVFFNDTAIAHELFEIFEIAPIGSHLKFIFRKIAKLLLKPLGWPF